MKLKGMYCVRSVFILSAFAFAACSRPALNLEPSDLHQAIDRYIRVHPEVIEQSLQALEVKRLEAEKVRVAQAIAMREEDLLRDRASPVSGNMDGDVTIVEFFDYRCGYCKRVAGAVTQLQQEDPGVRIVYKDFPILGEISVFAAQAALASQKQGKHKAFHEALLAAEKDLTRDEVMGIAERVGMDIKELEADLKAVDWQGVIDRNRALARALGISGTPGFIIGYEVYPGALELHDLKALVAQARARP